MSCISVLRYGSFEPDESNVLLRDALLRRFDSAPAPHEDKGRLPIVTVRNKYFTATILLLKIGEDYPTLSGDESMSPLREDGLMLVFPNDNQGDKVVFDNLSSLHEVAEHKHGSDLLRLCIGVSTGARVATDVSDKEQEQEYSRRILWCLDRQYEYVEARLDEQGVTQGHQDRDKEGFARVVEVIEGTMWSSARMHAAKSQQLKQEYQDDTQWIQTDKRDATANQYVPSDASNLNDGSFLVPSDAESTAHELPREATGDGGECLEDAETELERVERAQDTEQERQFQQLESALHEAARIRDLSQSGTLSDDQRRQRAGDAAMLLMKLMGDMGLDEKTDYEEEDERAGAE